VLFAESAAKQQSETLPIASNRGRNCTSKHSHPEPNNRGHEQLKKKGIVKNKKRTKKTGKIQYIREKKK
jgi:hypothetical protein